MNRLFLDANVLFSAAYSSQSRLQEFWELPNTQLISSEYAIEEARRNLEAYRPGQLQRLRQLCDHLEVVDSVARIPATVKLPQKDLPILAAAIAARATHLITGDKAHFGKLYGKSVSGVKVLAPSDYFSERS